MLLTCVAPWAAVAAVWAASPVAVELLHCLIHSVAHWLLAGYGGAAPTTVAGQWWEFNSYRTLLNTRHCSYTNFGIFFKKISVSHSLALRAVALNLSELIQQWFNSEVYILSIKVPSKRWLTKPTLGQKKPSTSSLFISVSLSQKLYTCIMKNWEW